MEHLEGGSFLVYLTSRKPNLTNQILLGFALDIAKVCAKCFFKKGFSAIT